MTYDPTDSPPLPLFDLNQTLPEPPLDITEEEFRVAWLRQTHVLGVTPAVVYQWCEDLRRGECKMMPHGARLVRLKGGKR